MVFQYSLFFEEVPHGPQIVFSLFLSVAIFILAFNLEVGKMGWAQTSMPS